MMCTVIVNLFLNLKHLTTSTQNLMEIPQFLVTRSDLSGRFPSSKVYRDLTGAGQLEKELWPGYFCPSLQWSVDIF